MFAAACFSLTCAGLEGYSKLNSGKKSWRWGGPIMAEIRPFRGVRYNQQKNSDVSRLICPPYDIINSQQQDDLYLRSEYNFVRIEYNREQPGDSAQDNRYSRAAAFLTQWMKEGILKIESEAALYVHEHSFRISGKEQKRQDIIGLVKLEEWDKKIIRPHENIIPRAKSDRMSMLQSCRANTSPVLAMYEDPERIVFRLISSNEGKKPIIDAAGENGEYHKVWALTSPETIREIQLELSGRPLYIADGHHRYDSALTYMREKNALAGNSVNAEGYSYVMTSLVDMADAGMVILPSHRLVKGIPGYTLAGLKKELQRYFSIEELTLDDPGLDKKLDTLLSGIGPSARVVRMAVYGLEKDRLQVLTLKNFDRIAGLMPLGHGDLYRKMDVSLVDHVILEHLMGYQKDKGDILVDYGDNRQEAIERVRDAQYQLVFILNPVKPELIKAIADAGDRMPRKSTYFYPKAPAGLVFYKW
jgi:uncharacterized protein (DUF1015 family)